MIHPVEPKKVLCIHDLSGMGRCSLAVILPVLSVMGIQPVALPTVVLSTHTGGFGQPVRLDGCSYGSQALEHYHQLGVGFDCIYTGYLGGEEQVSLAEKAFALWPSAHKVVDPVMADNGKPYATVTPALVDRIRSLCRAADLILPPTRSLTRAKRSLAALPGGGGTPLAAAIVAAEEMARAVSRSGGNAVLVFLTDGRANIGLNGRPGREAALADARSAARRLRAERATSLLVDISPRANEVAASIAREMDARYLPLPFANAATLSSLVRRETAAGGRSAS